MARDAEAPSTELGRGSPQRRELLLDDAPAPGAVEEEGAESEPPPVRSQSEDQSW